MQRLYLTNIFYSFDLIFKIHRHSLLMFWEYCLRLQLQSANINNLPERRTTCRNQRPFCDKGADKLLVWQEQRKLSWQNKRDFVVHITLSITKEYYWSSLMSACLSLKHIFSPAYRRTLETEVSVTDEWWLYSTLYPSNCLGTRTLLFGIPEHLSWKRWWGKGSI